MSHGDGQIADPTELTDEAAGVGAGAHKAPGVPAPPPPLVEPTADRRRSPAEEARTLVAGTNVGTLASLSKDGTPWASLVSYGALPDGSPVLCISRLAEHARNLESDPRASLLVAAHHEGPDPMAAGRVSLAGEARRPTGADLEAARKAHLDAVPTASMYADFGDFSFWTLHVDRVRWVGGYGRMDWTAGDEYGTAEADPVAPVAAAAVSHMNEDHADALLVMAQALAGYPDAEAATCNGADRYGFDLTVTTPRGRAAARVSFAEPVETPDGLRGAAVELARRARAAAPQA